MCNMSFCLAPKRGHQLTPGFLGVGVRGEIRVPILVVSVGRMSLYTRNVYHIYNLNVK